MEWAAFDLFFLEINIYQYVTSLFYQEFIVYAANFAIHKSSKCSAIRIDF